MKDLKFSFDLGLFPVKIHVAYSNDIDFTLKFFRKFCKKFDKSNLEATIVECHGSLWHEGKHIFIWLSQDSSRMPHKLASIVSHEAVHASWYIEKHLGNLFDIDVQEPQAYIVDFLVEEILGKIWKEIKKAQDYKDLKNPILFNFDTPTPYDHYTADRFKECPGVVVDEGVCFKNSPHLFTYPAVKMGVSPFIDQGRYKILREIKTDIVRESSYLKTDGTFRHEDEHGKSLELRIMKKIEAECELNRLIEANKIAPGVSYTILEHRFWMLIKSYTYGEDLEGERVLNTQGTFSKFSDNPEIKEMTRHEAMQKRKEWEQALRGNINLRFQIREYKGE